MYEDQAKELRQLVRQDAAPTRSQLAPPRLLLVTAGKGGVGTTSVAIGLAQAISQADGRTLLVDAHPAAADVTNRLALVAEHAVAQVLSGWRTVRETWLPGPGGMHVLPSNWAEDQLEAWSPAGQQRLLDELHSLAGDVDYVVLDIGRSPHSGSKQLWQAADAALVVSTPDVESVMDAYAAIKLCSLDQACPEIWTFVNRASSAQAADAHARLALACRRFLGLEIRSGGAMESLERQAADGSQPYLPAPPLLPLKLLARQLMRPNASREVPLAAVAARSLGSYLPG